MRTLLPTLLLSLCLAGCATHVEGGKLYHADKSFAATLATPYGPVTITDSRQIAATTQPTVHTNAGTPNLGKATESSLGSLSFTQFEVQKSAGSWALAALCFVAAGLVFYFLRDLLLAGALAAVGVLALLSPLLLSIGAFGLILVFVLVRFGKFHGRLIAGIQNVLDKVPGQAEAIKGALKEEQAPSDAKVVAAFK